MATVGTVMATVGVRWWSAVFKGRSGALSMGSSGGSCEGERRATRLDRAVCHDAAERAPALPRLQLVDLGRLCG
eukprot:7041618-Prymnesium_polylepis.2